MPVFCVYILLAFSAFIKTCQSNQFNCDSELSCRSSSMNCDLNEPCQVLCSGRSSCESAIINCPSDHECDVTCSNDNACRYTLFNAQTASRFRLLDCATGTSTCTGITLYCPPHTSTANCIITGDNSLGAGTSKSSPITIYAVYGWTDIDSSGYIGDYQYQSGVMYCIVDYSVSCNFAAYKWGCESFVCDLTRSPTNDPLSAPTKPPTSQPSILSSAPTQRPPPTNSPSETSEPPSTSPSDQPTAVPSDQPTSAPVTSGSPTSTPTQSTETTESGTTTAATTTVPHTTTEETTTVNPTDIATTPHTTQIYDGTETTEIQDCDDDGSLEREDCSENDCADGTSLQVDLSFLSEYIGCYMNKRHLFWNSVKECLSRLMNDDNYDDLNITSYQLRKGNVVNKGNGAMITMSVQRCGNCDELELKYDYLGTLSNASQTVDDCNAAAAVLMDQIGFGEIQNFTLNIKQNDDDNKCVVVADNDEAYRIIQIYLLFVTAIISVFIL